MTTHPLIRELVHRTTVLVARLATSQGGRSSLAQIPDQVFLELVRELERQGVSRKVSADMFGVGLRTHRRQIHRVTERTSEGGRSLWPLILEYIARSKEPPSRKAVLHHFARDDELQIRAVLRDLCSSGLVAKTGTSRDAAYEASPRGRVTALLLRGDDEPNTRDSNAHASNAPASNRRAVIEEESSAAAGPEGLDEALDCLRATLSALRDHVSELDATQPPTRSGGA